MAFEYLRQNSTPEKQNQSALSKISRYLDQKLTKKVLDFLDKI